MGRRPKHRCAAVTLGGEQRQPRLHHCGAACPAADAEFRPPVFCAKHAGFLSDAARFLAALPPVAAYAAALAPPDVAEPAAHGARDAARALLRSALFRGRLPLTAAERRGIVASVSAAAAPVAAAFVLDVLVGASAPGYDLAALPRDALQAVAAVAGASLRDPPPFCGSLALLLRSAAPVTLADVLNGAADHAARAAGVSPFGMRDALATVKAACADAAFRRAAAFQQGAPVEAALCAVFAAAAPFVSHGRGAAVAAAATTAAVAEWRSFRAATRAALAERVAHYRQDLIATLMHPERVERRAAACGVCELEYLDATFGD
jgi:hypothetical protein